MNKKSEIQSLSTPKSSRIDVIGWNTLLKKINKYHVQGYMTHVFLIKSRTNLKWVLTLQAKLRITFNTNNIHNWGSNHVVIKKSQKQREPIIKSNYDQ